MLELPLVQWAQQHLGTLGAVVVLLILIGVRFLPSLIQAAREKRQAVLDRRRQDREWQERERAELRGDAKAAQQELHVILTNHIAHLEAEAKATREFHGAAVEQLREMTHQLREIRREHGEMADDLEEVKGDVKVIRGQTS